MGEGESYQIEGIRLVPVVELMVSWDAVLKTDTLLCCSKGVG